MGSPRKNYNYENIHHDGAAGTLAKIIIMLNVILAVLGACIIGLGMFILFETDFRAWIKSLELEIFWTGVYIQMCAGFLVIIIACCGIWGAYMKVRSLLIMMIGLMCIAFILELAGSAFLLNYGSKGSQIEPRVRETLSRILDYPEHPEDAARIMNIIQEYVGCCGIDGTRDYIVRNKVIPETCYDPIKGNVWYEEGKGPLGCATAFTEVLDDKATWIATLSLITAVIQLLCMLLGCLLIIRKKEFKQ